jgi:hypothetical protein
LTPTLDSFTPAPTPSHTIDEIDQPRPTAQLLEGATIAPTVDISTMNISLKQELYFAWAAEGGPTSSSGCTKELFTKYGVSYESQQEFFTDGVVPPELKGIQISPFFSGAVDDKIHLCIHGFPEDEIITIELYTPEETLCMSQDVRISDYYYQAVGEVTEVYFTVDWPRCSSAGQWTLVVKSTDTSLRESIEINWKDMAKLSASSLCDSSDDHISVRGMGYPHGESRFLGVYGACYDNGENWGREIACKLLEAYLIKIDDDGSFDVLLPSNLSSEYIVVPIIGDDSPEDGGFYDWTLNPGIIHYPEICDYLREEEVVNVIKKFNEDQTLAVRTLDSQILQDTCTDECFSWHVDYINELREGNLYEVQEQLAFEVISVDILDNTATVTTRETWRTRKHDLTTSECRYHQPTFSTQQTYTLVYDSGVWKVSWNNFDTPVPADEPGCPE